MLRHKPIGYVLVKTAGLTTQYEVAHKKTYDSYGGYHTTLSTNICGQRCEAENDAKPQVWKTRDAAERNCAQANQSARPTDRWRVEPIYPTNRHLRTLVEASWKEVIMQSPDLAGDWEEN